VASPRKTHGRCTGTIIQHWGHGIDHIDGIRFRYEFQDTVLLSNYRPGRSYLTQPASVRQTDVDRVKSTCDFGGMLRRLTSSKTKDRQKQTTHLVTIARHTDKIHKFACLLYCLFAWKCLNRLRPMPTPQEPRLHTCQPPQTHVMPTRSRPEGVTPARVPPVQQRDQHADSRR